MAKAADVLFESAMLDDKLANDGTTRRDSRGKWEETLLFGLKVRVKILVIELSNVGCLPRGVVRPELQERLLSLL